LFAFLNSTGKKMPIEDRAIFSWVMSQPFISPGSWKKMSKATYSPQEIAQVSLQIFGVLLEREFQDQVTRVLTKILSSFFALKYAFSSKALAFSEKILPSCP